MESFLQEFHDLRHDDHMVVLLGRKVMRIRVGVQGAIAHLPLPDPPWFPLEEKP